MTDTQYENPCDHDGKLCDWIYEEFYDIDDQVEILGQMYCSKCRRYRDLSKEELTERLIELKAFW